MPFGRCLKNHAMNAGAGNNKAIALQETLHLFQKMSIIKQTGTQRRGMLDILIRICQPLQYHLSAFG